MSLTIERAKELIDDMVTEDMLGMDVSEVANICIEGMRAHAEEIGFL